MKMRKIIALGEAAVADEMATNEQISCNSMNYTAY